MKLISIALLGALAAPLMLPETSNAPAAVSTNVAASYEVDTVHSSVLFKCTHLNVSNFYGRFNDFSGAIAYDPAKPEASSIAVEIKTESVDTHDEKRDMHLKSPDFLSAKEFPTATFKSKEVKKGADGKWSVTGDLTVRGVTKSVTCPFVVVGQAKTQMGERAGFEAHLTFQREDYGIKFMPDGLGAEVTLIISLEGVAK